MKAVERSFETLFGVRAEHTLVLVRSRSCGGLVCGDYWEHVEYDAEGRLAASYASFDEVDQRTGQHRSGYRKLSPDGRVLREVSGLHVGAPRDRRLSA